VAISPSSVCVSRFSQPAITPQFKMKREDKLFDSSFHRFSDLE
jgi:hypothetical protein